jgi:hypothetical protein
MSYREGDVKERGATASKGAGRLARCRKILFQEGYPSFPTPSDTPVQPFGGSPPSRSR